MAVLVVVAIVMAAAVVASDEAIKVVENRYCRVFTFFLTAFTYFRCSFQYVLLHFMIDTSTYFVLCLFRMLSCYT